MELEREVNELYTTQSDHTITEELKARSQVKELMQKAGLMQDSDEELQVTAKVKVKQEP